MRSRTLIITVSIVLLLLGLAGLVLPGVQGIVLILAGLLLLGQAIPAVRRRMAKWEKASPALAKLTARFRKPNGKVAVARLLISAVVASAVWALILYTLKQLMFHD